MPAICTENFYVGFEFPRTRSNQGAIYFRGEKFANVYQSLGGWTPDKEGWWILNRDGMATKLGLPVWEMAPMLEAMLESLERWLAAQEAERAAST